MDYPCLACGRACRRQAQAQAQAVLPGDVPSLGLDRVIGLNSNPCLSAAWHAATERLFFACANLLVVESGLQQRQRSAPCPPDWSAMAACLSL